MHPATLSLDFLVAAGKGTYMRVQRQDPPWRAVRAFQNESGESLVHLHNVSGGILGGDTLHLQVALTAGAMAQVTSVGATRIYRRKLAGVSSKQTTCFHVAEDALLEYLPEAIIPYAGARFEQRSEFHLAQGSGLIAWEIVAAGRVAHGESFLFDELTSDTTICGPVRPLAIERYSLHPNSQNLRSPARFGRFKYSATMWVCLVDADAARWINLERHLSEFAREISDCDAQWGVSALCQNGLVIRGLACEVYPITRSLRDFWQMAKHYVWQRTAVPPRKVN